ncbi:hypothetical protein EJ08DRAFT_662073 [Tothia fuscella]|uniref:Uncharacterized protein n=1 Tax=Tothia fuscella TaxID=1048955 RepID=A0A9P4NPH3_9PEZI|nr:hypothetical protein EJ08DRAFT_662073 [Tothia fuscella]
MAPVKMTQDDLIARLRQARLAKKAENGGVSKSTTRPAGKRNPDSIRALLLEKAELKREADDEIPSRCKMRQPRKVVDHEKLFAEWHRRQDILKAERLAKTAEWTEEYEKQELEDINRAMDEFLALTKAKDELPEKEFLRRLAEWNDLYYPGRIWCGDVE